MTSERIRIASTFRLGLALALIASAAFAQEAVELSPNEVVALFENRLDRPEIVPGQVIVKLKPGAAGPAAMFAPMGFGDEIRETSGGELVINLESADFDAMSAADRVGETMEVVRRLNERDDVEYAQPNFVLQIAVEPSDIRYHEQWHYGAGDAAGAIGLPQVWDSNTGDASVVVAVIDTGILSDHDDVAGSPNLLPGFDMISSPDRANDGDGRDADPTDAGDAVGAGECGLLRPARPNSWHGSHVAGTVGVGNTNNKLGVAGVNWRVSVVPVRVLGRCGADIVDINDAIRWAAGLDVKGVTENNPNPNPADVINLSLGGASPCSKSPGTQIAIDDAIAAGATVVVAAGNAASDASGFMPASCRNVITVAAADLNGNLVTRYSNFGSDVDILAPGGDVKADLDNDGNPDGVLSYVRGGYAFYQGTSMAAPHVAGVAALLLAQDPDLTPAEVATALTSNASPLRPGQCSRRCGAGLLDASFLEPTPAPPATGR